jgi:hypothetical protein
MTTNGYGEKGKRAAIIINAPPHFLTSVMYLSNTRSEYDLIRGIFKSHWPIIYATAPPAYDKILKINRWTKGELNLAVHITKKSGGIIPREDSETKNNNRTSPFGKLLETY